MITLIAAMTVTGMLAGCSGTEETTENADAVQEKNMEESAESTGEGSSALIVYFSWSGNTEAVAQEIQNQTGGVICR